MATLYLDVDTQLDFVCPSGSLYVPGSEKILARVGALNQEALASGHRLVATMDAHAENDLEFKVYPPHCVTGCLGQRKAPETIVEGMTILEKQSVDCFTNPRLAEWLQQWEIREAVVYGVVTEICVLHAARGLAERGIAVRVVANAVKELDTAAREQFFAELRAHGGEIV